jgi:ATP-binding cassette subfamily B protein
VLAILGVAFSVAPYFAVVDIVRALMAGEKDLKFYLLRAGLIALLWLRRVRAIGK